jgi:hypothetical protein
MTLTSRATAAVLVRQGVAEQLEARRALRVRLERESCQVGPKDASWPMHSRGSTAGKG